MSCKGAPCAYSDHAPMLVSARVLEGAPNMLFLPTCLCRGLCCWE